mmetsp:Transcript_48696/g.127250  ORF Transcript_48696/g.127250 Transcript_48696/m.127250 type:complete len:254 (-) Transcript_48696:822-1583(-)
MLTFNMMRVGTIATQGGLGSGEICNPKPMRGSMTAKFRMPRGSNKRPSMPASNSMTPPTGGGSTFKPSRALTYAMRHCGSSRSSHMEVPVPNSKVAPTSMKIVIPPEKASSKAMYIPEKRTRLRPFRPSGRTSIDQSRSQAKEPPSCVGEGRKNSRRMFANPCASAQRVHGGATPVQMTDSPFRIGTILPLILPSKPAEVASATAGPARGPPNASGMPISGSPTTNAPSMPSSEIRPAALMSRTRLLMKNIGR